MSENQVYLKPKQICELLGISNSVFWRLTLKPNFPQRVRLSARLSLWKKEEVLDFMESMRAEAAHA